MTRLGLYWVKVSKKTKVKISLLHTKENREKILKMSKYTCWRKTKKKANQKC